MVSNPRINSALVAAIRYANAAKANKGAAPPRTPGHYKPLANEQRPDEAFTTERAKKTGRANACSGRIFVSTPPDHFGPITQEYDEVHHRGSWLVTSGRTDLSAASGGLTSLMWRGSRGSRTMGRSRWLSREATRTTRTTGSGSSILAGAWVYHW